MMRLLFSLCLLSFAYASHDEHAKNLRQQAEHMVKTTDPAIIPGFVTSAPSETAFNDEQTLEAATSDVLTTQPTAHFLAHTTETRPYFPVDEGFDSTEGPFERVTCQESKPAQALPCTKTLVLPEVEVTPAKYSHYWCTSGAHRPDDPACQAKAYYNPARMYEAEKIHSRQERWASTCHALEEKERQGLCQLVKRICTDGPSMKDIPGIMAGKKVIRAVHRACWRYRLTYRCAHASPNTCTALHQRGCTQIQSKCLRKVSGTCVTWEQTFKCPKNGKKQQKRIDPPTYDFDPPRSLRPEQPNTDMQQALSSLSLLHEIQKELQEEGTSTALPLIFKGQNRACTIAFAKFKNCCADGGGWGVDLGLSDCDGEERDLAARKQKGLCHELGTYCAQKLLGVCIRKKRRFCCFPSKLARILHEQGRPQIGLGWGTAEKPVCRGLRVEELARLDFERLNLQAIYADLKARMNSKRADVIQRNLSHRVKSMAQNLSSQAERGNL